jgi:hypothetical protein
VIAFGCSIISPETYVARAATGIARARASDSEVFACQAAGSVFRSYNLILERFAGRDDLEALVLVHEDAEILDPDLPRKVRGALRDESVAVVGCVGADGVHDIAWWDNSTTVGRYRLRYPELGGGEVSLPPGNPPVRSASGREVQTVDGVLMALSPWAVRHLRFDESLGPHWGYDLDFCLSAREAGRKVVVADIDLAHYRSLSIVKEVEPWVAAHGRVADKWDAVLRGDGSGDTDWRARARRAEAEAVVARISGASLLMKADARSAQHAREMTRYTDTMSWRVTRPLRSANARRLASRSPAA